LYSFNVKTIEIGAFEAKTHFSQLLDEVERGAVVRISRRGKPVAVLKQDASISRENAGRAIQELRAVCQRKTHLEEIMRLRDHGRER
jgi:antitoxin (DNA-binding transcriptional repressor) of toxin-antitoxin stability system